jgi:Arc/MetJ-type ribon-helix-helix transcriptional regulator
MPKLTFSLDDETVRILRRVSEQKRKAQSLVVREAIAEYGAREDRLPDEERERRLAVLRELTSQPPASSSAEADRELRDLRRTRRTGWARPSD